MFYIGKFIYFMHCFIAFVFYHYVHRGVDCIAFGLGKSINLSKLRKVKVSEFSSFPLSPGFHIVYVTNFDSLRFVFTRFY